MIRPFQHNGRWLLAYNVRLVDTGGIRGIRSNHASDYSFELCWTGEEWVSLASFGMQFETESQANDYLSRMHARSNPGNKD